MTPDQYCQQKASRSGSSFYYSFLFLPPRQRSAITALYAFCREVDDVVDDCSDPQVALTKLHWWRQEIDRLFQGAPQHPITQSLQTALTHFKLPQEHFNDIIAGVEMDLQQNRYNTFDDLRIYCHRVAGVVGLLAVEIFGYDNPQTRQYAQHLGLAFQLTNIIRDVREDLDRDRLYLPMEDLTKFSITIDELRNHQTTAAIQQLLEFEIKRAKHFYQQAFDALPERDRFRQRSGIIMAEIYQEVLHEIERDGCRVLQQRIRLTPLRKLWLAWKTARREKKQYAKPATAV